MGRCPVLKIYAITFEVNMTNRSRYIKKAVSTTIVPPHKDFIAQYVIVMKIFQIIFKEKQYVIGNFNRYQIILSIDDFIQRYQTASTAQKMKFSSKDFFSNCDQIRRKLRIRSYLRKKSLMENFVFCVVQLFGVGKVDRSSGVS